MINLKSDIVLVPLLILQMMLEKKEKKKAKQWRQRALGYNVCTASSRLTSDAKTVIDRARAECQSR